MLRKIISGGQTGADKGGLIAGMILNLETGGTAPPGFWTDVGSEPALGHFYGLVEGVADPKTYPKRTLKNVQDSDGTLLVGNASSPGSRLTLGYGTKERRPILINPSPEDLAIWLEEFHISTLNVAGNRESRNPGIEQKTVTLLMKALRG